MQIIASYFNGTSSNILYYSQENHAEQKVIDMSESHGYKLNHISCHKEAIYKINNQNATVLIIEINKKLDYKNFVLQAKNENNNLIIIPVIKESEPQHFIQSAKLDVPNVYLYPLDIYELAKKLDSYNKFKNFSAALHGLKTLNREKLEMEQQEFYKISFHFMKSKEEMLLNHICKQLKENELVKNTLYNNEKLVNIELFSLLTSELLEYFTCLFNINISERREYLDQFGKRLLNNYFSNTPEEEILRPMIHVILREFKILYNHEVWIEELCEKLEFFFEIELKYVGTLLKRLIPQRVNEKTSSIIENTIHILMSSSADTLGNFANNSETKSILMGRMISQYESSCPKLERTIKSIKSAGTPIVDLIHFLKKQSKLFTSFKNEINASCTTDDFEFMLDFVFRNGIKVKYPSLNVDINNQMNRTLIFALNEYIIINSIYPVIENAIDARASNIIILLTNDADSIYIDISNDGDEIESKISNFLFDNNFSYKKDSIHHGLGLNITKNWLESISCKIQYMEYARNFRITIPHKHIST